MGASTLVFRAVTRAALGDGLLEHITGVTRPENAIAREGWPRVAHLGGDVEGAFGAAFGAALEAQWTRREGEPIGAKHAAELRRSRRAVLTAGRAAVRDATPAKRGRGRRPSPIVDLLVAGPPRFEPRPGKGDPEPWSRARVEAWERDLAAVLRDAFPHSRFLAVTGHRDEASPHGHAYVVPIDSQGRHGWAHVRRELARRAGCPEAEPEDPGRVYLDGKGRERGAHSLAQVLGSLPRASLEMTHVQDWLHERLGEPHGLERGERGSRRVHRAVDRVASAESRARAVEAEAARVVEAERERAAGASQQADAQQRRLDDLEERHRQAETAYDERRKELGQAGVDLVGQREELAELREEAQTRRLDARAFAGLISQRRRESEKVGGQLKELQTSKKGAEASLKRVRQNALEETARQRTADEELGSDGVLSAKARRGRERRQAHAAEVETLTGERDQAQAALVTRTTERDRALEESERRYSEGRKEGYSKGYSDGEYEAAVRFDREKAELGVQQGKDQAARERAENKRKARAAGRGGREAGEDGVGR